MPIVAILNWGTSASALVYPGATDRAVRLDGRALGPCYGIQDATDGRAECHETNARRETNNYYAGAATGESGSNSPRKRQQSQHAAGHTSVSPSDTSTPTVKVFIPIVTHDTSTTPSGTSNTTTNTPTRTIEHGIATPIVSQHAVDGAKEEAVNGYDDPSTTTEQPYDNRCPTPTAVVSDIMRSPGDEQRESTGKVDGTKKKWKENDYPSSSLESSSSTAPTPAAQV
ncbi:hypothetical protein CCMSSC00406_0004016 [Pleurotus cornucopiae]|uniref:Uncharacterized protein n=1 Tax=Pleurotus cornucopiae TaxID=5321 RepID=A0ACB7IS69_PLECO|nr:hypothetical protein CCMSSC00406_0004016 [Pleurotus cornucopiae]